MMMMMEEVVMTMEEDVMMTMEEDVVMTPQRTPPQSFLLLLGGLPAAPTPDPAPHTDDEVLELGAGEWEKKAATPPTNSGRFDRMAMGVRGHFVPQPGAADALTKPR